MVTQENLDEFVAACQKLVDTYMQTKFPTLEPYVLYVMKGKRYARIVRSTSTSNHVFAFVDMTNGDVLKPASWKAPAKHARGNLFDEHKGLSRVSAQGPAYL